MGKLAGALSSLLLIAACEAGTGTSTLPTTPSTVFPTTTRSVETTTSAPTTTAATSTTTTATTLVENRIVPAYFFHDSGGDDIGPGPFLVALGENVLDVEEAVWGVLAGPTFTDMDWGVSTAIPSGARTYAVRVTENVASVDLTARFTEGADAATLRARLAQLVYTVTGFDPAISGVIVFIEGDLLTPLDDPLTRSDFEDFLPAILIEWPTWESWSAPPVTVRGLARGTFQIEIMFGTTGTGRVIASRTVTIDSVAGWGSFEVTFEASELPTPEPARSLSIRVYETAADGTPINERVQPLSLRTDP